MKKTKQAFLLLIVFVIGQALLSCSAIKNTDFSKRRYMERTYVIKHKIENNRITDYYVSTDNTLSDSENDDPELIATLSEQNTIHVEPVDNRLYNKLTPEEDLPTLLQTFTTNSRKEKKQIKKLIKSEIKEIVLNHRRSGDLPGVQDDRFLLELILSFLLPPLAVYLHYDVINDFFWISLILTLLFWVPGVVFALLVITDTI